MVGYFEDRMDCNTYAFTFMRGTLKEYIDPSVTHVFVNGPEYRSLDALDKINECGAPEAKIVKSTWIEDCFKQQILLPEAEYIVG